MTKNKPEYKEITITPDPYLDDDMDFYSPEMQAKLDRLKVLLSRGKL